MFVYILPNILLPRKGEFKKFSPAWGKTGSGAVLYLEEFNSEQLGSRYRSAQFVLLRV